MEASGRAVNVKALVNSHVEAHGRFHCLKKDSTTLAELSAAFVQAGKHLGRSADGFHESGGSSAEAC